VIDSNAASRFLTGSLKNLIAPPELKPVTYAPTRSGWNAQDTIATNTKSGGTGQHSAPAPRPALPGCLNRALVVNNCRAIFSYVEERPAMSELLVIARLNITAGQETAISAALPKFIAAARSEPGNIIFEGYRSLDDPLSYLLIERYASRAAFDEHLTAPHYQEMALNYIVPRLDNRTIEEFEVIPRGTR
jgi:quinol monooxygenase YgiN